MKEYKIDYELSKKFYERNKNLLKPKMCYNNCFNVISDNEFNSKDLKVGYAYLDINILHILVRHAVLIYKGKIIGVTPFTLNDLDRKKLEDRVYYMFEELSIDTYLDRIEENDNYTDNRNSEQDVVAYLELCHNKKYNYPQIAENDFFEYIYPKLKIYKDKYKSETQSYLDRLNNMIGENTSIE